MATVFGVLLSLALLLGACGPEDTATEPSALARTTESIAADYQTSRDLVEARAQLQELEVANTDQWLLYAAEAAIVENGRMEVTDALVLLALDLGLQSGSLDTYAQQHGLRSGLAAVDNAGSLAAPGAGAAEDNSVPAVLVPIPTATDAAAAAANAGSDAITGEIIAVRPTLEQSADSVSTEDSAADPPTTNQVATPETAPEEDAAAVSPTVSPAEPTATPDARPFAVTAAGINVRAGPGVEYAIAGALAAGERVQIAGKNPAADWWEIILPNGQQGWIYGPLVETSGDVAGVAVAANIPTPPPPTATPLPAPTTPPVEPTAEPTAEPAPVPSGPDFRMVEKRLWDVVENGGRLDGPSVTCGEKRQLVVHVIDAAGNRVNGVAVQAVYGAQEIFVTGSQGKGDGTVEFVLGGGQAVKVIRDADGREVSSEEAHGLSTKPWEIPFETLIGGRFCTDDASCQSFVDATGCYGHYSWTVTFQRNY